jgi:hypothetical protein
MPRSPITWSSPPFSWPAEPELDEKSLNSPQPCQHGDKCTYKKEGACCAFVHPGEQGTGRVFFPARTFMDNGKQVYQKAAVRLVGSSFYERRRLGMSWPEWCAAKGFKTAPVPVQPVPVVHKGQVISNGQVSLGPHPSAEVMQLAYLFHAMQQQALAQAHAVQQAYAAQQKEAEAVLAAQHKQNLGNLIFAKVQPKLAHMKETAAYTDDTEVAIAWPENMTAGKLTGMFLEGMDVGELQELLKDDVAFDERFNEAIGILHDHWETVLKAEVNFQADRDARIAAGH